MKQIILIFALLTAGVIAATRGRRPRVRRAPKRAAPTLEQRVADLEAYVNNGARGADNTNKRQLQTGQLR